MTQLKTGEMEEKSVSFENSEEIEWKPSPMKEDPVIQKLGEKVPLIKDFLTGQKTSRLIDKAGGGIATVAGLAINNVPGLFEKANAAALNPVSRLVQAVVNFVKIPAMFVGAAIAGEKLPFKLSTTAKWLYSAAIVGISAVAVALPFTAPFIYIGASAAAAGYSAVSLVHLFRQRKHHKEAIDDLTKKFDAGTKDLDELSENAKELNQLLQEEKHLNSQLAGNNDPKAVEKIKADLKGIEEKKVPLSGDPRKVEEFKKKLGEIDAKIQEAEKKLIKGKEVPVLKEEREKLKTQLKSAYNAIEKYTDHRADLQNLYDERNMHQVKLQSKDNSKVRDKAVAIALGAVTVAGAILTVFFPPVGAGLLLASGLAAGAYAFGPAIVSKVAETFPKIANWFRTKFGKKEVAEDPELTKKQEMKKDMKNDIELEVIKKDKNEKVKEHVKELNQAVTLAPVSDIKLSDNKVKQTPLFSDFDDNLNVDSKPVDVKLNESLAPVSDVKLSDNQVKPTSLFDEDYDDDLKLNRVSKDSNSDVKLSDNQVKPTSLFDEDYDDDLKLNRVSRDSHPLGREFKESSSNTPKLDTSELFRNFKLANQEMRKELKEMSTVEEEPENINENSNTLR